MPYQIKLVVQFIAVVLITAACSIMPKSMDTKQTFDEPSFTLASGSSVVPTPHAQESGCEYWIAPPPAGNNVNPGTSAKPWATIEYAAENVPDNSCTVSVRNGLYEGENRIRTRFTTPTTFKSVNAYKAILENSGPVLALRGAANLTFEGFEFRHTGPGANQLVVDVSRRTKTGDWAEHITFRNNIFHDSYNNDLLKIYNGSRFVIVENNIFYNQGHNEQHMDVNSVTDVIIQDNIFFNDFNGSGRALPGDTKHFIMVKDSNGDSDGHVGSERVTIRRNIFLNWEGGKETFVKTGNDGKPYHEARNVLIENNLMIGNGTMEVDTSFGVRGARDITFRNNTIVGDLPSSAYAFRISITDQNPRNENIYFLNNIWSDPTGTMGADGPESDNEFSNGDPADTINLVLDNNLYWNGGKEIPPGDLVSPLIDDAHLHVGDPLLNTDYTDIVLPRWNGNSFTSGNTSIRQEFERLAETYCQISPGSSALDVANPGFAPAEDILGRPRYDSPDMGACEYQIQLSGAGDISTIWLWWKPLDVPEATNLALSLITDSGEELITDIPINTTSYTLTDLLPYTFYKIRLLVLGTADEILVRSNAILLLTTDIHNYMPSIFQSR